jgi:DNA-nicking Smr family endonuclease
MPRRPRRASASRDPFDPLDGPVSDTLDLHGLRADEARLHVPTYLMAARRRQPGALIHIITGKGRGSPAGPVLRGVVRTLLRAQDPVLVAAWGPDRDDGGFLVRLTG